MHHPFNQLDCTTRMFIACLCVVPEDLASFRLMPATPPCCMSAETTARAAMHRLLLEDESLAADVSTVLDLRHIDTVEHVRTSAVGAVAKGARHAARQAERAELAGWAWALLRDHRQDVRAAGNRLMAEVYVRGMGSLASGALIRLPVEGGACE